LNLESFVCADVGVKRRMNEDNFSSNSDLGLFVVADGMGGHAAGEVASRLAVEEIESVLSDTLEDSDWTWAHEVEGESRVANKIRQAVLCANDRIRNTTRNMSECRGMGTTIVAAVIDANDKATIAHVGDSRAYLFRHMDLRGLTSDHSWVNEQLKQGFITAEHARNHPFRNVITQALGSGAEIRVDAVEVELQREDILLLCSDGLNSMLSDLEICEIFRKGYGLSLDILTRRFIDAAKERGGDDNITVALIRVP